MLESSFRLLHLSIVSRPWFSAFSRLLENHVMYVSNQHHLPRKFQEGHSDLFLMRGMKIFESASLKECMALQSSSQRAFDKVSNRQNFTVNLIKIKQVRESTKARLGDD